MQWICEQLYFLSTFPSGICYMLHMFFFLEIQSVDSKKWVEDDALVISIQFPDCKRIFYILYYMKAILSD